MTKAYLQFPARRISYLPKIVSRRLRLQDFAGVSYKSDGGADDDDVPDEIKTPADFQKALKAMKSKLEAKAKEDIKAEAKAEVENQLKTVKEQIEKLEKLKGLPDGVTAEELVTMKAEHEKTLKAVDKLLLQAKEKSLGVPQSANLDALLEKALTEALPTLKNMKAGIGEKGQELTISIKAAVNVLTTAVANASGVTTPDAVVYQEVTEYAADVRADAYIINFLDNGTTNKASLPYMDKLPNEGTMAITAEGALKPLISVSFELRYSTAEKIAGRTKVSEEALDDVPYLMSIIRNELKYEHDIAEQTAIFTKINAVAGAFVAGGMAASTDAPTNYDAIRAAIYGIKIASKGRYIPNAVLVPSADAYNMGATKDKNNQYVMPTFVMPDGSKISGVQVVEVNDDTVAEGSFVVGDFRKLKRRIYKGFTLRIGQGLKGSATASQIESDFENNMYTMLGESRLHLYVYENEKVAFTKSTFAAVKTAIETTP